MCTFEVSLGSLLRQFARSKPIPNVQMRVFLGNWSEIYYCNETDECNSKYGIQYNEMLLSNNLLTPIFKQKKHLEVSSKLESNNSISSNGIHKA